LSADDGGTKHKYLSDGPGFVVLSLMLRLHGVGGSSEEILRRCGTAGIGIEEMLRCAKELGLTAHACAATWKRLTGMPLPRIAALRHGGFLILGKVVGDIALVGRPSSRRPLLTRGTAGKVTRSFGLFGLSRLNQETGLPRRTQTDQRTTNPGLCGLS
jgi:subfamily B ATP-binding cassette protein HlyB/CyaB